MILHYLAIDTVCAVLAWTLLAGKLCEGWIGILPLAWTGAGVWLIYTADRWLDSFPGSREKNPGARHRFVGHHRRAVGFLWIFIWLLALGSGLIFLNGISLLLGSAVVAIAVAYLWLMQKKPPDSGTDKIGSGGGWMVGLSVASAVLLFPILSGEASGSEKFFVWLTVGWIFSFQTRATRSWESGKRIHRGKLALFAAPPVIMALFVHELVPLAGAGLLLFIGILVVERLPISDRVAAADWTLALSGGLSYLLVF